MNDKLVNIKKALKAARITQTGIAEMLKVSPVAIHNVVSGKKSTPRIRLAIAMAIGKKVLEIDWPSSTQE